MAKPYREGSGWCVRQRYRGHDIYVSGGVSPGAAQKEARERIDAIDRAGKPQHLGPQRSTLACALQEFALEHLPRLKGAPQEARRINKYLEAAGLEVLVVQPASAPSTMHHDVDLKRLEGPRAVPRKLVVYRASLSTKTARSDKQRQVLAQTRVAHITSLDVQNLMNALAIDGQAPATIALERALLRRFFNHARTQWAWAQPSANPAIKLELPRVDNARNRVLSLDEQVLLDAAFQKARNPALPHLYALLRETGMRASEPLLHATWSSVDWEARILKLSDGKDGKRDVPLSTGAIKALEALKPLSSGEPGQPLADVTYQALKSGFRLACKKAGIKDLRLQDLRHTAATRLAKESGNVFLVKALTGHKTDKMVFRYANVKADDVVEFLHAKREHAAEAEPSMAKPPVIPPAAQASPPAQFSEQQVQALIEQAVKAAVTAASAHASQIAREAPDLDMGCERRVEGSNVVPFRRSAP